MKNLLNRITWLGLLFVIWLILFEKTDSFTIVSGIVISFFALYYTEKYLLKKKISKVYPINLLQLFKYFCFLIYEIYASGIDTLQMILKGNVNPTVIELETSLKKPYLRAMLANSITLTPGTVTLDLEGQKITILWINPNPDQSVDYAKLIKFNLEKQLLKGEDR